MIFYFSGTGTSQFVAKQIAQHTNDSITSINYFLKTNTSGIFKSKTPIVFVVPTYYWRIPKIVDQWIRKAQFEGNKDAYFILTCSIGVANASSYVKRLCRKKGFNFRGLTHVIMPENYLVLYPTPDESQFQALLEKSKPFIELLAEQIKKEDSFDEKEISPKDKYRSSMINFYNYLLNINDKGFTVDDNCISCNKCVESCPLNNIKLISERPVWQGNCTHCMACIACCPEEAIEYKDVSKGRNRNYIMEEDPLENNNSTKNI